jgi:hypothetical protein
MRFFAAIFVSALLAALPAAAAVPLAPHQALYDIEMVAKRSSTQVVNISGKMFFEFRPVCDAYTTNHRFSLSYEYADSPPLSITSNFSTYETADGRTFDYNSRRRRNGEIYEELGGEASLDAARVGKAVYSKPGDLSFDLGPGTLFPMAHTIELLKQAKLGKKFFTATVFDGSDDAGPVTINAVIGPRIDAPPVPAAAKGIDAALLASPAWKVRLAFFPLNSDDAAAEYEMNVLLHENGVISDMRVDYHDFSVTQKLVALKAREAQTCRGGAAP